MTISLCDRVENTVGKGENVGDQHFLLFRDSVFQSFPFQVRYKSRLCGIELKAFQTTK